MNLTILRYNQKNVCVLPIISEFKKLLAEYYQTDKRTKLRKGNCLYLISGINYIPTEYWDACKKHNMVNMLLNDNIIEEIRNEELKSNTEIKKIKEKKDNIIEEKEKKKEEIEKAKEEMEKIPEPQKKEKQKNISKMEKEIEKLNTEEDDTNIQLKKLEETVNNFKSLSKKQKEKIIVETFDPRSLEKFLLEEMNADIRHAIQLRIDEILNAKTDETIGHPKDHLKTSGK